MAVGSGQVEWCVTPYVTLVRISSKTAAEKINNQYGKYLVCHLPLQLLAWFSGNHKEAISSLWQWCGVKWTAYLSYNNLDLCSTQAQIALCFTCSSKPKIGDHTKVNLTYFDPAFNTALLSMHRIREDNKLFIRLLYWGACLSVISLKW